MEDLLEYPRITRMPNMLLVAPSFNGKSSILERFLATPPPELDPEREVTICPVVMIESPPNPDVSAFYTRILDALMAPYKPSASSQEKNSQIKVLFKQLSVKILIVDEIHHLIAGSLNRQKDFRNALKSLAFNTICVKHHCMLHDRCPACGAGVEFHRMDIGHGSVFDAESLTICHACGFNLAEAPLVPIVSYDKEASWWHEKRCAAFELQHGSSHPGISLDEMRVLHHLVTLLVTRYKTSRLRQHICDQLGVADLVWASDRVSVESRPLNERHHLVQLGAWLMLDLDTRLCHAWRNNAVRYNHLLKGLDPIPGFYVEAVAGLSDWHRK